MVPTLSLVVISALMLLLSYLVICYLTRFKASPPLPRQSSNCCSFSARFSTKRVVFLVFAFGVASVTVVALKVKGDSRNVPIQSHIITTILNFILLLLMQENDVLTFAKRKTQTLFELRLNLLGWKRSNIQPTGRVSSDANLQEVPAVSSVVLPVIAREPMVGNYNDFPAVHC